MIHIHFNLDKKTYRSVYTSCMSFFYLRIYIISLLVGTAVVAMLGIIFRNNTFSKTAANMVLTFIPVLLVCMLIAYGMALYDVRKISKRHPELMSGDFKMKFEKNFMVMQKDGQNKKFHYDTYRIYHSTGNSFILYQPDAGSIVVPKNLVTKEQYKTIKNYVKGK